MRLSRRRFFRGLGAGVAVAASASSRIRPAFAQESPSLSMVWWGDTEAVGIHWWIEDTIARFHAETGIAIQATLVDIDDVVDGFTRAAESGTVPDVQFFW